jgi:hypothetical protein
MLWPYPDAAAVLGLLLDFISGGVTVLVGFTGLFAGTARYGAVLANLPPKKVEWATGIGFFAGLGAGLLFILATVVV